MGGTRPRLLTRLPSLTGTLERPRLLALVAGRPVVTITAPAGSGVTTLAAQIAADDPLTTAWCRLAAGFDQVADVVEAVALAAETEIDAPASRVVDAAEQLLDLFEQTPMTLVVDDHHLAANADIDRVIAECVDLLPPGCRIVVAGAARPAGLIGLVAPHQRAAVGTEELSFNESEAAALFEQHGSGPDRAAEWVRSIGGWAQALMAGALSPDSDPSAHLDALLSQALDATDHAADIVAIASALPYVTRELLTSMIGDDAADLTDLVERSPLFTDHGEFVRMTDEAAARFRSSLDAERLAGLRRDAAARLVESDPVTAIDVLLDAGEHDAAADALADHLSEIGVERALTWLYRLPADLRRRFPPVLAAGQATVEVDTALAAAQLRVETADSEKSRREALLALGSIEAHRGELAAAANALESALRSARHDQRATERISFELAHTRFLLGDVTGARVALADAEPSSSTSHLMVQLDIIDGVTPTVPTNEGDRGDRGDRGGDAFAAASAALIALIADQLDDALSHSERSYSIASEQGGEALVAGAVTRAAALVRHGDTEAAEVVVDEMERRLGPRHRLSRVYGATIRERISRSGTDRGRHERDERRLRDHRQAGYALIERLANILLREADEVGSAPGVVVHVLGTHSVTVDGRTIRRGEWKSKKALEVLTVLAARSPRGARREALIEDVWPGRDTEKGRTLLRTALSEIRRMLEPGRPTGEASAYLETADDIIRLDGRLDLDIHDDGITQHPVASFTALASGLADEVQSAEWAQDWTPRAQRLLLAAATSVPDDADPAVRIDALEALITAEPWQRAHYDALAALHRAARNDVAAADVERRWFADD